MASDEIVAFVNPVQVYARAEVLARPSRSPPRTFGEGERTPTSTRPGRSGWKPN